jgi:hypothetical protein
LDPIQLSTLEGPPSKDNFLVVVLVPAIEDDRFRFFILTHEEMQSAWAAVPKTKRSGEPLKPGWEGIGWSAVKPHENAWHKLPGWQPIETSPPAAV